MTDDPQEIDLTSRPLDPVTPLATPESSAGQVLRRFWRAISWYKIGLFLVSLFLFILALTLMKEGAKGLTPLIQGRFALSSPANSLGFGWLFAYVIMSGSPVAASALTFYDAGIISQLSAFTMISGSRIGASFIVLFIGFVYVLRGRNRSTSLSMGLLSFTVTGTLQAGVLIIGILLLPAGIFDRIQFTPGIFLTAITDLIFDPIVGFAQSFLPNWGLFIVGLVVIMFTFNLFDKCLPDMTLKDSQVGRVSRLVYRPAIMFFLGAGITLISMSVSVSLSILVPLSHRGFVRRENVIPYIMGANITTFIDTLLAAVLLNNPGAITIVVAQMIAVAVVSILLLVTIFKPYERLALRIVGQITRSNFSMAIFMIIIFAIPLVLLFF
jgi:solute carrier family 34 (sodium-dependent phosphate cotransporter)